MTKPLQHIVDTLAAGIHAAQQENQRTASSAKQQAIADHITSTYPEVSLRALMRRPHSLDVRELLVEDLADAGAAADALLAQLALELASTVRATAPAAAQIIGVDLTNVTAETLNISDVQITIHQSSGPSEAEIQTLRTTYLERCLTDSDQLLLTRITTPQISATGALPTKLSLKALYIPLLIKRVNWHEATDADAAASTTASQDASAAGWIPAEYESALKQLNHHQYLAVVGGPGSGKSSLAKFLALCMAGELLGMTDANVGRLTESFAPLDQADGTPKSAAIDSHSTQGSGLPTEQNSAQWEHGGLLPIFIELSDFVADGYLDLTSKATADLFLKYLDAGLVAAELERFEESLRLELRDRGGVLCVDGLDEVADTNGERQWIQQAVADFALSYPKVRILLTSRPYAFPQRSKTLPNFHRVQLAPFIPDQIEHYIAHSFPLLYEPDQSEPDQNEQSQNEPRQTEHENSGPERGKQQGSAYPPADGAAGDLDSRVRELQAFVRQSVALSELAQTPLMLALMVALFAWRKGALPERRETLYSEGVKLLLSVWEEPKQATEHIPPTVGTPTVGTPAAPSSDHQAWAQFPHERIRTALEGLAYQNHKAQPGLERTAPIDEDTLLAELARATAIHPILVADYLHQRSGILVQHTDGRYHFPHRAIQEYMAACHLHNSRDFPRNIIALVRKEPQRWREVFLLAAAKEARVRHYAVSALINRLCPVALPEGGSTEDEALAAYMVMLCGRLLIETGLVSEQGLDVPESQSIQTVRRLLAQIVEKEFLSVEDRLTAATALGALGDTRPGLGVDAESLPHLAWHEVEAGPFLLGADQLTCPLIEEPYAISRYPITAAQFQTFVDAGGYQQQALWTPDGWAWLQEESIHGPATYRTFSATSNQPQVGISWYEAVAFCQWLSAKSEDRITLPTEPEWERAARGTDGRNFPWGEEFSVTDCNMRWTDIGYPSPVGIFPKNVSPCGVWDMAGNVWEWCSTAWQSSYEAYETTINNELSGTDRRVLRGGSWANQRRFVRCANRHRDYPNHRGPNVGFRVVKR